MLRHAADRRTLVWAFVLFPLVPIVAYVRPSLWPWLVVPALYTSYCSGVLTHYHQHRAVFTSRRLNLFYSAWLSFFYGLPTFTWIPTHNQNHHRYLDGPGDDTSTSSFSSENSLLAFLLYPSRSSRRQLVSTARYVAEQRRRGRSLWRLGLEVSVVLFGHLGLVGLAMALHGVSTGLFVYALSLGAPAALASFWMMLTNYAQHVHCDPSSPNDHSRNFVAPWFNWLVFDAGYHTVHHEQPGTHWSRYAALHRERAPAIDPALNEHSIFAFCFKQFVLGPLAPRFRTRPRANLTGELRTT